MTFLTRSRSATSPPGRRLVAALIIAGSCVLTNAYFVGWGQWPAVSFAYVVLAGVLGYRRLTQVGQLRGWLPSVVLALFWLASTGGARDHLGSGPTRLLAAVLAAAQMTLVVRLAYEELWSWQPEPSKGSRRWLLLLYAGVPLAYWGTYLIAYFPARMTLDSFWQWGMAHQVRQYNDWHPVLHTWLIELTSSVRDTPYTYVILQLVVAVSVIAYALWSLQSFGAPRWLTVVLAVVYAAYPASAFFSVTMWKDVPFAYLVLLTTTMFAWVVWTRGRWLRNPAATVALSVCCFLTMHIRSNGLPAILLALLLAVVFVRSARLRLGLVTGVVVAAHLLWVGVVLPHSHVLTPPATQALAIPTQQIGATYASGGVFAPEVGRYFNRILPAKRWRADYRPYNVNPIKHDVQYRDSVILESFPTYLTNWSKLLKDNPSTFVSAFLDQTGALWQYTPDDARAHVYVGSNTELQDNTLTIRVMGTADTNPNRRTYPTMIDAYYRGYNPNGCAPTERTCRRADQADCFMEPTCVSQADFAARVNASGRSLVTSSRSKGLKSAYDQMYEHLNTDWQGPFARGAIPLFLLILALAVAARRERLRLLVFAPAVCVALSVAAGMPATDLRYAYGWIISVPFLLVLALLPPSGAQASRDGDRHSNEVMPRPRHLWARSARRAAADDGTQVD